MLIRKAFRYRIYPSEEQQARLARWEDALRFLWNLAHEQRLLGLSKCRSEKRYPPKIDQINELTELREELEWLSDVPRNVSAQTLVELDKAWQRCFKRLGGRPRFKKKNISFPGLCEPHPKVWRLDRNTLRFPKLGWLPAIVHRPLEGKPKTCTIKRDGDQWFASILCEVEIFPEPKEEPVVAVDRGVAKAFAMSDGTVVENPAFLKKAQRKLARAQRDVARKKKGSNNQKKAKANVLRVHRKVRRQREHFLHVESHRIANSHGRVIVENLNVKGMTASASGTIEQPGRSVKAKSGLNRSILDVGWSKFGHMLKYKLEWSGGTLVEVPAAYSSQTCSACWHVDKRNRVSQADFKCVLCGHEDNADVNAAKVLLSRGIHGEAACGGPAVRRPKKQELRAARRGTSPIGRGPHKAPSLRAG